MFELQSSVSFVSVVISIYAQCPRPDDDSFVFDLIQHLDVATAENVFEAWHHPYKERYAIGPPLWLSDRARFDCQRKITQIVKKAQSLPRREGSAADTIDFDANPEIASSRFPPLSSLTRYLAEQQARIVRQNPQWK
jgi:hypothetical protein